MTAEHVATIYETLERPLVPVLGRMEGRGIAIDRQVLSRLSGEFAQKQGLVESEALTRGLDDKAKEFREGGSELSIESSRSRRERRASFRSPTTS